jgi:hypothetical protein
MRLPCVRARYAGGNVRAMPLPAVVVHSAEGEILDYGDVTALACSPVA